MNFRTLFVIVLVAFSHTAFSQSFSVSGRILDETDTSSLIGVGLTLALASDTTQKNGTVTDVDGNFIVSNVAPGQYILTGSYIGFKRLQRTVNVVNSNVDLGIIKMEVLSTQLSNVTVQDKAIRAQQLGDTTQFNSNSYKTNPDANAEDLITKMPGITSDNEGVKVNGETVKEVLVDGKPFFGDDPNAALKNLPAEIIDKIQVFDKLSDQAQFTGFDDGSSSKSINIVTKRGRNAGQFGKIYAGYGYGEDPNTHNRYQVGGNINFFNGDRRISLIGMSNNINQQNFSIEDITGSVGASTGGNRGGGRGGPGGRGGERGGPGGGGFRGGGSDFLIGQQGGISTTNSVGLNYSDNWGKKLKVSGSYFFNATNNNNSSEINRNYFTSKPDSSLFYSENSTISSRNTNHRANLRLEYDIDSNNSIVLTPRLSIQNFNNNSDLTGINYITRATDDASISGSDTIGRILNRNTSNSAGINFSNGLLYRHKFNKDRRTLSLNLNTSINNRDGDGTTYSFNEYQTDTTTLDLRTTNKSNSYTLSGNLTYTEPVGNTGQLSVSYNPSFSNNEGNRVTDSLVPGSTDYAHDSLLSNVTENTYTTHKGGISYRVGDRTMNLMLGVNGQYATLEGNQFEPYPFVINKNFSNILPTAMFNYRFSQSSNLRLMYRTSTNPPSISQLQDVVDISNPLLLRAGNPDLKQDYNHTLTARYGITNSKTAQNFFVFAMGNIINNYIGNETIIPSGDTTYNGYEVNRGAQITRPVNLSGYFSGRTFVTYGMPLDVIKSNLNLNAGFNYTHAPSLINRVTNFSDNYSVNGGFVLGSNISENLDFTLSYNANYSTVNNTLQTSTDNSYFSHLAGFKINWIFLDGFVVNTSLNHNLYTGLSDAAFNQQFLLWNAYVGYKFLKNRALEARISAYDILNQNKSISRNITETYVEDVRTQVLTRYFMLTLTYTLRNFKAGAGTQPAPESNDRFRPDMPPGGGRPEGGRGNRQRD